MSQLFAKLRLPVLWFLATGGVASALLAPACGSSPAASAPCNQSPWQCTSGQTCWANCVCPSGTNPCTPQNCTPQFSCMGSKVGIQPGDNCAFTIDQPSCGDNQACVFFEDAGSGTCRTYCDQNGQCAPGYTCTEIRIGSSNVTEHVCEPPDLDGGDFDVMGPSSGSGGTGGGSGGSGSGGSLDAALDHGSEGGNPIK